MNRSDLIRHVSRQTQHSQAQIEELLDLILDEVVTLLLSGDGTLTIRNFGRFELRCRRGLTRRNPKTGEEIKVPAKRAVIFQPAKSFKEKIQE